MHNDVKAQVEDTSRILRSRVVTFLDFHRDYTDLANHLARAVANHATPVGSGTVAPTKRIPVEQRAEAAVIAWMRHQTTGYDSLVIPRVKREETRKFAEYLLRDQWSCWSGIAGASRFQKGCPLQKAF